MRWRWTIVFPLIGLFLFSAESYHSVRMNREVQRTSSKYFWWSSVRLDIDPLNRHPETKVATTWDLRYIWIDPALLTRFLILSALPAFVVGELAVIGFGRLGISEFSTFMFLMPVLIFTWYYLVGWLFDRWLGKRRQPAHQTTGRTSNSWRSTPEDSSGES